MTRIPVTPELLTWARERVGLGRRVLAGRFYKLTPDDLRIADTERFLENRP